MIKYNVLNVKLVTIGVLSALFSVSAQASLYVSPVSKDAASVNYVSNVVNGSDNTQMSQRNNGYAQQYQEGTRHFSQSNDQGFSQDNSLSQTGNLFAQAMHQDNRGARNNQNQYRNNAQSGRNVGFGMSVHNQSPSILMNQGKDIPLFVAVEAIIPDTATWTVHYDEGMHNLDMTWNGGDTWEGVLQTLAFQNKFFLEVNHAERVVGLGKSAEVAKHLAKKIPTVWRADTKKTLRENLKDWAERSGWELAWDKSLMIDYPVEHGAVFTGELVGKDGAVDSILSSYRYAEVPLKARFFKKNKVVLVTRGGFEQELSY